MVNDDWQWLKGNEMVGGKCCSERVITYHSNPSITDRSAFFHDHVVSETAVIGIYFLL